MLKEKSLTSVIMRVVWHTIIYIIWAERNNRIHTSKEGTMKQRLEQIKKVVIIRLIGLKNIKFDSFNFSLYRSWD